MRRDRGKTISDITGILAASITTQPGLKFVACGLGAYPVAIFHLVLHAFLKIFLFLTAPSFLHPFHRFPDPTASRSARRGASGVRADPYRQHRADHLSVHSRAYRRRPGLGPDGIGLVLAAAGIMAAFTTLP